MPPKVPKTYQEAFFPLTAAGIATESANTPFDIVIIGSGIGGGVLATSLLDKNELLAGNRTSFGRQSTVDEGNRMAFADRSIRILVIEKGGLLFTTHSLNGPGPTTRGTYGQMNDLFYNKFKDQFDMDAGTAAIWEGGAVYSLGGRSPVWGLFCPRIDEQTLTSNFPPVVHQGLTDKYYRKAEEIMNLAYPTTLPLHQALMDNLNLHDKGSYLPTTQWKWGRVASEFRDPNNFDFAQGAFSTTDRLLEASMDDATGKGKFKNLLNTRVERLHPKPVANQQPKPLEYVVVKDSTNAEHKIYCNKAVLCAGSVEGPAILLRSVSDAPSTGVEEAKAIFGTEFGHVTDHYICYVAMPFFYRNMGDKDRLGGMKLMTDLTFTKARDGTTLDGTTALANISLDASSFLPRRKVPDRELPQFIIAYILPSALAPDNKIELNNTGSNTTREPKIKVGYATDAQLAKKREVLVDFAVEVMNRTAKVLDLQFAEKATAPGKGYKALPLITRAILEARYPNGLGVLGPGGVAHELGSLPMPRPAQGNNDPARPGIVDNDLKIQKGWTNVYVCDLSVLPYSPAANPTLTLGALALRLADKLSEPPEPQPEPQPIGVYNLTQKPVWVNMTLSGSVLGQTAVKIEVGKSHEWKRMQREVINIGSKADATSFDVQMVYPNINAIVVKDPPTS